MPRYRKLHVKITESYDVNDMPDDTHRLLWTWLMLGADREGRYLDNPAAVKSKVFPLRADVTHEQIAAMLDWFAQHHLICRYVINGRGYFYLTTFKDHQGDTAKEAASVYPDPPSLNNGASQEEVQSSARPAQEEIKTNSGTDAQVYTDADAATEIRAAEKTAGADPPPPAESKRLDQQMWDALVEVCHVKFISKKTRGTLNSTIPILASMGLSPPDIRGYAKWYENDWYKKNAPLHLGILEKSIGAWLDLGKPASRVTQNGSQSEQRTYDHEVMDKAKFRAALSEVQGRGMVDKPLRAGDDVENGVDTLPGVRAGPSG